MLPLKKVNIMLCKLCFRKVKILQTLFWEPKWSHTRSKVSKHPTTEVLLQSSSIIHQIKKSCPDQSWCKQEEGIISIRKYIIQDFTRSLQFLIYNIWHSNTYYLLYEERGSCGQNQEEKSDRRNKPRIIQMEFSDTDMKIMVNIFNKVDDKMENFVDYWKP